jgi:acetyltransferase-like isoleucine patch superfamily enzyme
MRFIFTLFRLFTEIELFFLKHKFKKFGKNVKFGFLPTIKNPKYISFEKNIVIGNNATLLALDSDLITKQNPNLKIGNNIYIGHNVSIHCMNSVELEDNVVLSDNIYISDVSHGIKVDLENSIMNQQWESSGVVKIGKGTFLGNGTKVLPNVKIGNNCVVAAGSIVTKSCNPFCMLAGSPAKIIKKYCFESQLWKKTDEKGNFTE